MFTFQIFFQEPRPIAFDGPTGSTFHSAVCMGTALAWFATEYPTCIVHFFTFTANRAI